MKSFDAIKKVSLISITSLCFVLMGCQSNSSSNNPNEDGTFSYTLLKSDTYSVKLINLSLSSVNIPSTFNNKVVSVIEPLAFNGSAMTEITIPSSIQEIGYFAFQKCLNLKTLYIPKTVTKIGDDIVHQTNYQIDIFCEIDKRPSGYVYDSGTSSDGYSSGNWSKSAHSIAFNIKSYQTSGDYLLAEHNDETYRISSYLGRDAVVKCPQLIDNSQIIYIGGRAFAGNSHIQEVELPSYIKHIKTYAFCDCESLAKVKIPSSLTHIYESAFSYCPNLTSLEFINENNITYIDDYAFRNSGLSSFSFNKDLSYVGAYCFTQSQLEEISYSGTKEELEAILSSGTVFHADWAIKTKDNGQPVFQIKRVLCSNGAYDVENNQYFD